MTCSGCASYAGVVKQLRERLVARDRELESLRGRVRVVEPGHIKLPNRIVRMATDHEAVASSWAEDVVRSELEDDGYVVLSRGYPDFLALDIDHDGFLREARAVEVKMPPDKLRPEQEVVLSVMRALGLSTCVRVVDNPRAVTLRSQRVKR